MEKRPVSPLEPSIIRSTLRALLHPRRLIPIVLLSSSLVVAQANYSHDPLAIPLGIAMCVAFVIAAPLSWRVLFPDRFNLRHGGIRLILYGTIATGTVLSLGVVVPKVFRMSDTLLTDMPGLDVSLREDTGVGAARVFDRRRGLGRHDGARAVVRHAGVG